MTMRAVVVITDADALRDLERAFLEAGRYGFTVVPVAVGRGRTGLKAGDRVHPGGSSLLFSIVPEPEVAEVLALVRTAVRGSGMEDATKIYAAPIDELSSSLA
jgi:nitrogen regulatory protein PII